jgi:hypothetical protein
MFFLLLLNNVSSDNTSHYLLSSIFRETSVVNILQRFICYPVSLTPASVR